MGLDEAYRERRRAELDEWRARLDLWQAKAATRRADLKVRLMEEIESLHGKLRAAGRMLSEPAQATGAAREDPAARIERAWDDLRKSMAKAETRFR